MVFALIVFTLNYCDKREKKIYKENVYSKEKDKVRIFNLSKILLCKTTIDVFYGKQGMFRNGHVRTQR